MIMKVEINDKIYENAKYEDLFNILSENLAIGENYDFVGDDIHISHIMDYKGVELSSTLYDCEKFEPIQLVIIKYGDIKRALYNKFNHIKIFLKK